MTWWEKVLDKIFSGRFLVTVMMASVYCFIAVHMVTKLSEKITGDFMLGFIGGFSTSFMLILQWYFDKESDDKKIEKVDLTTVTTSQTTSKPKEIENVQKDTAV